MGRAGVWGAVLLGLLAVPVQSAEPDFQRDVRPILSQFCLKCHGPDEGTRQSGLRLDLRDAAIQPADSGRPAIVPGRPEASELLQRIASVDPELTMPPPETHQQLSAIQKETLRRWIAAGAPYAVHWAFVPPRTSPAPVVQNQAWVRNPIDRFVLSKLEERGWQPNREADRHALIRRVSLDLIGLPPSVADIAAFVNDPRPDAYERLVERLLASPQYGERWARDWLDLARYADTNGYEKDRPRSVWPYRDWVIDALNADLPFDQFTIAQLAGDLLPQATLADRIATGFHRQTMLNEEGGIDPLEYRFHALADRTATTGTVWLGMTVGCAQCHTHKYDPLTHTEYYQLLAFLNNADELEQEVPTPALLARREELQREIAVRERELPQRFPPSDPWKWSTPHIVEATSAQGATLTIDSDESILVSGQSPESDTYTLLIEATEPEISAIRIEALTDASLGNNGPGRTAHGNFVITGLQLDRKRQDGSPEPLSFQSATADFSQERFPAERAIDGQPHTGWAIQGTGQWNVPRALTVRLAERVRPRGNSLWTLRIEQWFGSQHTLGKFRIRMGHLADPRPSRVRQQDHFQRKFAAWLQQGTEHAVAWKVARPTDWTTTLPKLTRLEDDSLLTSGDLTKRDVFTLNFGSELDGATAIRLEALPDERLPKRGPGAIYYEGPRGDFFLSELVWNSGETRIGWAEASQTFANTRHTAAAAIDGDPLTGWSIDGGQGQSHVAIFRFERPLPASDRHELQLIFERYYAAALGRFRVSYTHQPFDTAAAAQPVDVAELFTIAPEARTPEQRERLLQEFCRVAPELANERSGIDALRRQMPEVPTALIFQERPVDHPRPTHRQHRGEFLQPREVVTAGVPAFLPPLTASSPDRLEFARWLVSPEHPLTARVTVNRHWQALFGRGLVRTVDDFGYQGESPSHPELLDWLALEFQRQNWSPKALHRLLVTSATYRQDAATTAEDYARDPQNVWLARGPRRRLSAEQIRDNVLATVGLLSDKQRGPSVYPPQPESVTTEGTYGRLAWTVSPGEDRYRRGLYTFSKRTAPYAMFATFDAPSGEACTARRDASNTPLQALTLLNDAVLLEAARKLGTEFATTPAAEPAAEPEQHARQMEALFLRVLGRPARDGERAALLQFWNRQHQRLQAGELTATDITGDTASTDPAPAAWILTARVLLNLDEAITTP